MNRGPLFRSSRRTREENPQSVEEALKAVSRKMPTPSDVATDINSGIIQQAPKGKSNKPRRKRFSVREAYAIRDNENKEMLRSPRTSVDDLATTDDEELLVLMDEGGNQIGRSRSWTADVPSQTSIKEARMVVGNADSAIAWSRQKKTRSIAGNRKNKPNLSIIDLSQYNFLEHREPENYACFRDDKMTPTTSADGSRREMPPTVCRVIRCDDSERTDHHDDITQRRTPCIPMCGEFDRDGRNFRQLDEEIEVVATKFPNVPLPAEDACPLPPSPSQPKKYGLTSFFSGRMKKMEQARQRRRKLDQMKMEKDEKKKKGKKLGFLSSKMNKSSEEIQKQISTTKNDVLALAQEFRGRGLPDSQDEQLSSSDKASSKHLVMAKINTEEEQLFIADFDRHFETDESPQGPGPFVNVRDGPPPSSFSSPDDEKLGRRSYMRKLSTERSKRRMPLADEQTEQLEGDEQEQRQHQDKEKVENGDQRFMADFDPKIFESKSASFKIDEADSRDGPASEDDVEAQKKTQQQQQQKDIYRSPPSRAEPLPDPNAAAGLLLTKLQDQRRAAERRLETDEVAKHQTISTDIDLKQIERKVRTMHELTHLQDNSKFARSISSVAIEASILEKVIASLSQETLEESRETFEDALEQTDTYIKHLASLSGEPDEETPVLSNTQLSKQEIDFILEDVSSGVATCNVVSAIKEELSNESTTAQPTSIRKPKLTQREFQEALAEHEKQLQQDSLCAITEEDTIEEDSATGTGASERKRRERPASTTSPIQEEDSTASGIVSTSTSSTDDEEDGNEDDESSDSSEETEQSDEEGMLSFDESVNTALSTGAESAKSNGHDSVSLASIHPTEGPVAPGCFWWNCWPGSSPKPIKQLEQNNSSSQVTKLPEKPEQDGESLRSVSTRGSYESERNGIRHISSAPTSQSFDEDDDLLDRIEYGLCGNRR